MRTLFLAVFGAVLLVAGASSCGSEEGRASDASSVAPHTTETTPSPTLLAPPTDEDLVRVGRLFVRFARGDHELAGPPVDTPVLLMIGSQPVSTISSRDAMESSSWEGLCPDAGGYAERTCPFSFLEPLAEDAAPITFSMAPAQEPCSRPHGIEPSDVGATRRVTLLARPHGSCFDYAAVEQYVNDVSQVVAANLVLGSP